MKSLFDPACAAEIQSRVLAVKADVTREWGKMNVAQAMAHSALGMQMALGDVRPPRMLIGRIIGRLVKRTVVRNDNPIGRNAPTAREMVVADARVLDVERARLHALIERFSAGKHAVCTSHPHPFFGSMTPDEWAILSYKHLDHHLRQFST